VGARFSAPVQTGPGAHTTSCTMGTGSFPEVKDGRGLTLTPHPLLVPWSRKGRDIPLLPLRAVRSVQSLSACTRVQFAFFLPFTQNQFLILFSNLRLDLQSCLFLQVFQVQCCISFRFSNACYNAIQFINLQIKCLFCVPPIRKCTHPPQSVLKVFVWVS
jgi:hypothetical protein